MLSIYVSTAAEVVNPFQGLIIKYRIVSLKIIRSNGTGSKSTLWCDHRRMNSAPQIIRLGLICLQIPTKKYNHIRIVLVPLINYRFTGILHRKMQKLTYIVNGMFIRCIYQSQFRLGKGLVIFNDTLSRLHIGAEITLTAQHNRILSHRSEEHILM